MGLGATFEGKSNQRELPDALFLCGTAIVQIGLSHPIDEAMLYRIYYYYYYYYYFYALLLKMKRLK